MKRLNNLIYLFGYLVQGLLLVFFNTFLPVLLITVLGIPESEIAFAQLISYAAFLIKPIFALLSDKTYEKTGQHPKRKTYIFLGSIGLFISFLLMIISIQIMILFGIFWSINYFFISIIDVAIDGNIIDTSPNIQTKKRKIVLIQIGNSLGNVLAYLSYILIINNIYNINDWNNLFTFQLITLFPLIILSYFIYNKTINEGNRQESLEEEGVKQKIYKKISIKTLDQSHLKLSFICISAFLILFFSEALVQVPYEPWLVGRFGQEGFEIFSFFLIFAPFINIIGYLLINIALKYSDRKKILYFSIIVVGIFDMCIPLMDLWTLIILGMFVLIPNAIAYIAFVSLMMEFAGNKFSYKYQILALMVIISMLIFGPLGTFLSGFIDTGILLVIVGILTLSSIIPIIFIKMQKVDNRNYFF